MTQQTLFQGAPLEILVVEDSPVEAELLRRTLARSGYQVSVARNGEEGLQAARSARPALVLSDIRMPEMNGYELCRKLKYDDELWDVPVILLTVLSEPEDILEAINSGADSYIIKPFVEDPLLERIRALINMPIRRRRQNERRSEAVQYGGKTHTVTGGSQQILNLLISLYENTLVQNRELISIQSQLNLLNEGLDEKVRERTAALEESEERYRIAMETARDAFIIVDGEGGAVREWNPAAEAIFGYSKEEMIGRGIHEIIATQSDQNAALRGMEHFATTGEGDMIGKLTEVMARHKNGAEFPIEMSLSGMQLRGKWYASGIGRDITGRKKREAEIWTLNRALRTLSACNTSLVRAKSEDELLLSVCKHIVEIGGFLLTLVEDAGEGAHGLRMRAHFGDETLFRIHADLAQNPGHMETCLAAKALRERRTQVCADVAEPGSSCSVKELREAGVKGIIALPLIHGDAVYGVLSICSAIEGAFGESELKLAEELASDLAFGIVSHRTRAERDQATEIMSEAMEQTITAIALTVEKRDPYTSGHQQRVARIASAIAAEMGLPPTRVAGIRFGSLIHDIGKIYIPSEILNRPGKLTDLEFGIIKTHPQVGYDIVKDIHFPWPVAQMVHQHHERLDGSGYPQGLKGEQIILEARILAVADVLEAMSSHRPFRPALGLDLALQELERGRGKRFDAEVVETCVRLCREKGFPFPDA